MTTSILVVAYGNPSRGDDALGPELLTLLESKLDLYCNACSVELLTDFQLQPEHALDLLGRDLVLFVDASVATESVALTRLEPARDPSFTTHAMSPEAILHVYDSVQGGGAPPAYLLAIGGEQFELGEGLSSKAQANLLLALKKMDCLLRSPTEQDWDSFLE